ncbi:hypothetical protein BASA81_001106 [Batrachochytrium salamandrivorans]|nr:hypothetical protein BASA81_001106 [Batrachochytrium salamandrivorans]
MDSHGRRLDGLFEACGATNYVLRNNRVDALAFAPVPAQHQPQPPTVFQPLTALMAGSQVMSSSTSVSLQSVPDVPEKRRGGRLSNKQKQEKAAAAAAAALAALPQYTTTVASPAALSRQTSHSPSAVAAATITPLPFLPPHTPIAAVSTPSAVAMLPSSTTTSASHHKKQKPELFCLCKNPYQDDARFMIGCDGGCQDWFHPECLGYHKVERKGHPESFFDVDNTKLDEQSTEFLCPNCELQTPSSYPKTRKVLFGQLVSKWADVVDQGESVRWRLLVEARSKVGRDSFAKCLLCSESHHPLLPCASEYKSNDASQLVAKEEQTVVKFQSSSMAPSGVGEDGGLVVGGKYQQLMGRITHSNKRLALLKLDRTGALILVPHGNLFMGNLASITGEDGESKEMSEFHGVRQCDDGFVSALRLPNGKEVFLGKFESKIRAARVHDVACRLEFGETGFGLLNFPEQMEGELQQRCQRGPFPQPPALTSSSTVTSITAQTVATSTTQVVASTLRDAQRVVDWCEGLLQCLRPGDASTARLDQTLCFLASAVMPSASRQMNKLSLAIEQHPVTPDATEDEMDLVMKKLVRARTPRARQKA